MEVNLEMFKQNYLVVGLSDEDIAKVAELAKLEVVSRGHEIVKLGARDPDLYIILDGIAMVYRKGGALLGERGPCSVIGEISLVDNQPRSAYVISKASLTYAHIDGRVLRQFMYQNKEIGFIMLSNLARVLSMRLREASETIEDLRGQLADPWIYTE
ncbi:MAG: cyclic nucleotide-binding domain-containing protein [Fimbriimonas sp.]|nr:cyclic nucleotide-binding domain-containing protein [Fimbriimonas sp.]